MYNALGAVRHTRLARTTCISLQHGNIPVGRNNNNNNNNLFLVHYIKKNLMLLQNKNLQV